jgi:hypothetical protein
MRMGRYFYLKRLAAEDTFKLYVRDDERGQERLLVDPKVTTPGASASIDFYEPSPSGRHVRSGSRQMARRIRSHAARRAALAPRRTFVLLSPELESGDRCRDGDEVSELARLPS